MPNAKRCQFCFKYKELVPIPVPGTTVEVCKGCFYELDKTIGFLDFVGYSVVNKDEPSDSNQSGRLERRSSSKKRDSRLSTGTTEPDNEGTKPDEPEPKGS